MSSYSWISKTIESGFVVILMMIGLQLIELCHDLDTVYGTSLEDTIKVKV